MDALIAKNGQGQTKGVLQTTLSDLETRWEVFQTQDDKIRSLASDEDSKGDYFTQDIFSKGEDAFCLQRGSILDALAKINALPDATTSNAGTRSRSSLPKITLPTFSGSYTEWTRFKDLFTSLVLDDDSWSDAERFHYLSASLTGDAAQVIRRIPLTTDNFARAWELLEHRYENRRLLIDAQFDILHRTKSCSSHTAAELKRVLNTTCNVSSALNSLDIPVDDDAHWMVQHTVRRLDSTTLQLWETSLGGSTDPLKFSELIEFLETTIRTLESFETRHGNLKVSAPATTRKVRSVNVSTNSGSAARCSLCQGHHILCFCEAFRSKTPQERLQLVSLQHLCQNCLGSHAVDACRSSRTCQRCAQRHHTMIHDALARNSRTPPVATLHIANGPAPSDEQVSILLATALVSVVSNGRTTSIRALIDPCSEVSLVSEALAQHLRLPRTSCSQVVVGAGAKATTTARGKATMQIASRYHPDTSCAVEALILPRLTAYRPRCGAFTPAWTHVQGLKLADPSYTSSASIDILLGADVYPRIILDGIRRNGPLCPVAQETIFGWILSGPAAHSYPSATTLSCHACTADDLSSLVRRFWEQEEVALPLTPMTTEDAACEQLFKDTHARQSDGRYIVNLCLKHPMPDLGETHSIARRILLTNERKLQGNDALRTAYLRFMAEYRSLEHMQLVPDEESRTKKPHFYLPHHGVLKGTGASTKLRVVFNGSRTSTTGTSVNDHLLAGPKLQRDLMDILLRWRRHKVAFITNIEKMYRQIRVHPAHWDYQRILWRDDPDHRIHSYHLTTVTYGLTCAPYLALRTLLQLAEDEEQRFPRGAAVLRTATYVDDILSGADSVEEAKTIQRELIDICRAGGFPLKKWSANHAALLSELPHDSLATTAAIPWHPEMGCSALGLTWHPATDVLSFTSTLANEPTGPPLTKRRVLSQVAKLFDPLGWVAPFVIRGKIILQDLWRLKVDWDEHLPSTIATAWMDMLSEMTSLAAIRIPRWLGSDPTCDSRQLHVFVDASEKAYAAVVYLRLGSRTSTSKVTLLAAKTKVAPLKCISVPRMELCAATLGTRLLVLLRRELHLHLDTVHLWSDSTVTLAWLRGEPTRWRTYVANRVSEVQTSAPDLHLHHVRTEDNPADCASRGISASLLTRHPLWWHGPAWLAEPEATWAAGPLSCCTDEEARQTTTCLQLSKVTDDALLLRFSTARRLIRVTAWCLRWSYRRHSTAGPYLLPEELLRAEDCWIRQVQHLHFAPELAAVQSGNPLPRRSRLRSLTPFLDDHDLLRVGGRIPHSLLSYDEQHPVLLPPGCHLTQLLIERAHQRTLHGGAQLTLAVIRQRYWIPQGRQQVKKSISRCLRCIRWRAAPTSQLMGDLPPQRVIPSRPFTHAGVDYAGPFQLTTKSGRGHKATKGYVAIFVCFSTRAVHIEAVSDYSASAFLAAFHRFSGRRGLCSTLTSDCGTNFVGANQELRRLFTASSKEAQAIAHHLTNEHVTWKFIPPGAPHFGGLWEAAVRSVKHHLRRVIGDQTLTYEEFSTFLCQVEACLNSRPLQALSDDSEDLNPLTPGHFLIGGPLTTIPEPTFVEVPTSRLSRWQLVRQRLEHFWRRWTSEYLHHLQSRKKWTDLQPSVSVGDLVLIRSELTPPTKWPLARISDVHPGADGQVRVATVRTASSSYRRPVTKLVYLRRASEL